LSRQDIARWQQKYAAPADHPLVPDPLLEKYAQLLRGPGLALDLACGRGRNSIFLAQLGKTVFAVDGSLLALQSLRQQDANIHAWVADLEHWTVPGVAFDLIVVNFFLLRPLLPGLTAALRPHGLLLYQTFNCNILHQRPGFSSRYLLEAGELQQAFAGLTILASNDTPDNGDSSSFILARKAASE